MYNWSGGCDIAFANLKKVGTESPSFDAPDWSWTFRRHMNALQIAVDDQLAHRMEMFEIM